MYDFVAFGFIPEILANAVSLLPSVEDFKSFIFSNVFVKILQVGILAAGVRLALGLIGFD